MQLEAFAGLARSPRISVMPFSPQLKALGSPRYPLARGFQGSSRFQGAVGDTRSPSALSHPFFGWEIRFP